VRKNKLWLAAHLTVPFTPELMYHYYTAFASSCFLPIGQSVVKKKILELFCSCLVDWIIWGRINPSPLIFQKNTYYQCLEIQNCCKYFALHRFWKCFSASKYLEQYLRKTFPLFLWRLK